MGLPLEGQHGFDHRVDDRGRCRSETRGTSGCEVEGSLLPAWTATSTRTRGRQLVLASVRLLEANLLHLEAVSTHVRHSLTEHLESSRLGAERSVELWGNHDELGRSTARVRLRGPVGVHGDDVCGRPVDAVDLPCTRTTHDEDVSAVPS